MDERSERTQRVDGAAVAGALGREGKRLPERLALLIGGRLYAAVALLFVAALLYRFFDAISRVLLIAFVGVIFAIAMNAVVRRIPLPRGIATAVVALSFFVLVGVGVWQGMAVLTPQLRALAGDLPALEATLRGWEESLREQTGMEIALLGAPLEALLADPVRFATTFLAQALGILEILGLAVLVLFGAIFVVARPNDQLLDPLLRAVPRERRPAFRRLLHRTADRLAGWLRGTVLSMVIIGVLSGVAFWLLGAPYPLLLGVWVGLVEVIPIVGPLIGGATAVLVTLIHDPAAAIRIAVAVLVIQQVEGSVVRPFVMSGAAELHPFVTLLALLLFATMFGFLGALLALPILLVMATAVEVYWVEERLDAADDEIEPVVR
jgi:predicted PurR-regulated permease PerM